MRGRDQTDNLARNVHVLAVFLFRHCDFLLVEISFPFAVMLDGMIGGELQAYERLPCRVPMVLGLLKDEPRLLLLLVMQSDQLSAPIIRRRHHFYYLGFVRISLLETSLSDGVLVFNHNSRSPVPSLV